MSDELTQRQALVIALREMAHAYVENYEWRDEASCYTPTPEERVMMHDCAAGLADAFLDVLDGVQQVGHRDDAQPVAKWVEGGEPVPEVFREALPSDDAKRLDAIDNCKVVIQKIPGDGWSVRAIDSDAFKLDSYHTSHSLRTAIDAALGSGNG